MPDDPGILRKLPEHVLKCYESLRLTLRSVAKMFSRQKLCESAAVLLKWGKHLKKTPTAKQKQERKAKQIV